uniref:Uncharacterized protein n=1 Tax=Triticum urartu TaxID=4572 RepID=A0A8R7QP04_TRIUA
AHVWERCCSGELLHPRARRVVDSLHPLLPSSISSTSFSFTVPSKMKRGFLPCLSTKCFNASVYRRHRDVSWTDVQSSLKWAMAQN